MPCTCDEYMYYCHHHVVPMFPSYILLHYHCQQSLAKARKKEQLKRTICILKLKVSVFDVYLRICMYTSVYLCIWTYVHQCVLVYLDVHQCVLVYLDVHQCVHVYLDVTSVYLCIWMYTSVYLCISDSGYVVCCLG